MVADFHRRDLPVEFEEFPGLSPRNPFGIPEGKDRRGFFVTKIWPRNLPVLECHCRGLRGFSFVIPAQAGIHLLPQRGTKGHKLKGKSKKVKVKYLVPWCLSDLVVKKACLGS